MTGMWKVGAALALGTGALANAVAGEAEIRKALEGIYPTAKVREVNATKMKGIFEVVVDQEVLYADADGKHFFIGAQMIDVERRANVTDERKQKLSAIKWEELPLHLATKIVKGDGSRVFASFEDANCGYCKRLHQGLKQLTNYTQYVFVVPMMGEDSRRKADAIWCSKDRVKAVNEVMTGNMTPTAEKCVTPTSEVEAFAKKLGVTGTPTLFMSDGSRVPGYLPPERLEQALARVAAPKTAEAKVR